MRVPRWIVHVFDPAERYFEAEHHRPHPHRWGHRPWRGYREGAVYWPGESRRMTDEELVLVRSRVAEHLAGVKASLARTWERSADLLVAKGTELCRIGIVSIPTTVGVIGARVVRFRWGDSVLDTSVHAERGAGSSMLRLSRVQAADPAFLAECLARSVAKLTASNPDGPD